jgi:hypothetical protein
MIDKESVKDSAFRVENGDKGSTVIPRGGALKGPQLQPSACDVRGQAICGYSNIVIKHGKSPAKEPVTFKPLYPNMQ